MSNVISIELEKSGFPIAIGEVEFFFNLDDSYFKDFEEKIKQVERDTEDVQRELKELSDEKMNSDDIKEQLTETVKGMEVYARSVKIKYDSLLGGGSFDKLRSAGYSALSLDSTYPLVVEGIERGINEYNDKKIKTAVKNVNKYVKKSKNKKKKK